MDKSRIRPKSSCGGQHYSRLSSSGLFRPSSCLIFSRSQSPLFNNNPAKSPVVNSLSGSSVWRVVSAARCQKHIQKAPIQAIRKNLSQKMMRLKDKRMQQEQKYEKTISIIRKKCSHSTQVKKQQFKQAHNVINGWLVQQKLEYSRYKQRLLRLKL